jgi:RNA polymerase sigma-70 factor (ECF subfamily)
MIMPAVRSGREEQRARAERLGELFDRHQERLHRLARRMSADAEEARDLVQETFVRLARQRGPLPSTEGHAEGWLVKTLVRLCKDRDRRLRVRRKYQAEAAPPTARVEGTPESRAVAKVAVQRALARLSPRRRAVIVMHELDGRKAAEIASLLGLTPVTVRWHLHAARRDLKKMLLQEGWDNDENETV